MAISDLSTVSAGRPRAFVCNRGADAKVFSITTRIAATALLALGAIAAIPANNALAQTPEPTFKLVNPMNQRLEIVGGLNPVAEASPQNPVGEVTLQIQNYVFPNESNDNSNILVVDFALVLITNPRTGDLEPAYFGGINDFPGTFQMLENDQITVGLANNVGTNRITMDNRPYLVRRSSAGFRVVMPKTLFSDTIGTQPAAGFEDVTIILTPNAMNVVAGDTAVQVHTSGSGSNITAGGGVFPAAAIRANGTLDSGQLLGARFNPQSAVESERDVPFSLVHPYADGPLPRMMNPATQDLAPASVDSSSAANFNIRDSAVITVALPPGVMAPATATSADILLDFSVPADNGLTVPGTPQAVVDVEEPDRIGNSRDRFNISVDLNGDGESPYRTLRLITPAVNGDNFVHVDATIPGGTGSALPSSTEQDLAIKVIVTPGRPLYGDLSFSIFAPTITTTSPSFPEGNMFSVTATGIVFYESDGSTIVQVNGSNETPLTTANTGGPDRDRESRIRFINAKPDNTLTSITLDDITLAVNQADDTERSLLTIGDDTGSGYIEGLQVTDTENVVLDIDLNTNADRISAITGTDATGTNTALTVGNFLPATMGDRTGITVQGFTRGHNTLLITLADAGSDDDRIYTISVFVPPSADDSSASVEVGDAENNEVTFTGDRGTEALTGSIEIANTAPTNTTPIVVTPGNPSADVTVCTIVDTNAGTAGVLVPNPSVAAPVTSSAVPGTNVPNFFRIVVAAPNDTDGPDCTAATDAAVADADVTVYILTVTVLAIPPTAANLASLTVGGNPIVGFDGASTTRLNYAVTLADGNATASPEIIATPAENSANIEISVTTAINTTSPDITNNCGLTVSGTNTCTVSDINAGDTAVVTIAVTPDGGNPKTYTVAVGPASARLTLAPGESSRAVSQRARLILEVRNYNGVSAGGFLNAVIAAPGIPTDSDDLDTGDLSFATDDFSFDLNDVRNAGINAGAGSFLGGYDAADPVSADAFRVKVPKALLDGAGKNNSNEASLINSVDVVLGVTVRANARIGSTDFSLTSVNAVDGSHQNGANPISTAGADKGLDPDATVALTVTGTTIATLSIPATNRFNADRTISLADDDMATAVVSISNPLATGSMTLGFRMMVQDADGSNSAFLDTGTPTNSSIIFTRGGTDAAFTVRYDPAGDLMGAVNGTESTVNGQAGWTIDAAMLADSPVEVDLTITANANTAIAAEDKRYTLVLADYTSDGIDEIDNPVSPAILGKIKREAFMAELMADTVTTDFVNTAVEGVLEADADTITGAEDGEVPITIVLPRAPTEDSIALFYEFMPSDTTNTHAAGPGDSGEDYDLACDACLGSSGRDVDIDGGGNDDNTGSVTVQVNTMGENEGAFTGNVGQFTLIVTPSPDNIVEGTETAELRLYYLLPAPAPANTYIMTDAFTVNITDSTTSSVTVTPDVFTVDEGRNLGVTIELDEDITLAEAMEFTLEWQAPTDGPLSDATDVMVLPAVTMAAGGTRGSVSGEVTIVADSTPEVTLMEEFRLGIASIAAGTVRPTQLAQLPESAEGSPPNWEPTADIVIGMDSEAPSVIATLFNLTVAEGVAPNSVGTPNVPTGFTADTNPVANLMIDLAADMTAITVVADPTDNGAEITGITGRQGDDCSDTNEVELMVTGAFGNNDGLPVTATIPNLATGDNCFAVVVTAADNTATQTYTVIANVAWSNDATLAANGLTLAEGTVDNLVEPTVGDAGTASANITMSIGHTSAARELVIEAADADAVVSDIAVGTNTGDALIFSTPDYITVANGATTNVTGIDNNDTFTFTVTAEDSADPAVTPGTIIEYTITFIVQDARLGSAVFAGDSITLQHTDVSLPLGGSGSIAADADTAGGSLVLTPATLADTIVRVTGTNERRQNLMGIDDANRAVDGSAAGVHTLILGDMSVGTNELIVVVRPAGAGDDTTDRTYTIGIVVPFSGTAAAGIKAEGTTSNSINVPNAGPDARTAKFDFFTRGMDVAGIVESTGGVRFTLRFVGTRTAGPLDAAMDFTQVGDTGVFNNNYYKVTFPTHDEHNLEYLTGGPTSDSGTKVAMSGDIRVQAITPAFTGDGTIYIPVEIELNGTTTGGASHAINGGTVSVVGVVSVLSDQSNVATGDDRPVTPVASNLMITYTIVDGPVVSLTSAATATEAGEVAGELDMTLTRNLATLNNQRAVITYTIGAETGAATLGTDYTLNVGGATAVCIAATGAIAHTCTLGLGGSDTDAMFAVMPMDDSNSEDDETVTITVTAVIFPALSGAQPTTAGLPSAGVVTITDNDATAVLGTFTPADRTIGETGTATFTVALSSLPSTPAATTIDFDLSGTADYTTDYAIDSTTAGVTVTPMATSTDPDIRAVVVANAAVLNNDPANIVFTITPVNDGVDDGGNETIIVDIPPRVSDTAGTVYAGSGPAANLRTITIEDADEGVSICSRSAAVQTAIRGRIANKACELVTRADLEGITGMFSVTAITAAAPLLSGDFDDLIGVTTLTLESTEDIGVVPNGVFTGLDGLRTLTMTGLTYTRLANGVLDDVLGDLTALNITPSTIAFPTSPAASNVPVGSTGQTITLQLLEDSEVIPTRVRVPVTISGAARDLITLSGSGVDTNAAGNTADSNTATYGFTLGAGQTSITFTATVTGAETGDIGDSATLTLGTTMLSFPDFATRPTVADRLATASATPDHDLTLTLPPVSISLAPSEISIGEKSLGSETITLTLNGVLAAHGSTARVMFDILDPDGDETAVPGVPTLDTTAFTSESNPGDYTLVVNQDLIPNGTALMAAGNTFEITSGTSATFTFTAIDDDRREGSERTTITVTGVNFPAAPSANITGAPTSATVEITEISGDDVMRETEMITHIVGKEQVNLVTGLVRQRVNALTLGTPQGFSTPGVQVSLAENPETMQDFFSQMALESSGEMDDGGAYAIWGRGQYISISGSPDIAGTDNFEYDGTIGGVGMGIERRFSESLFGLSMNFSSADIDSKSSTRAESNYKETMTFFAPYAAWKPDNSRLTLWGAAGAGFGTAEITGEGHAEGNPSVQAFFAQGGVDISDNIGKTAEVVFGLSAVAIEKTVDAFTAGTLSVPETESSVFQGQADFTAYFPVYSDDGQVLRPYVGLASVHDAGDVLNDDRHAMELQTGIAWSNGPWQVSLDTFYQFLRDDEEAWGIFGEAHWTGTGDLDGLLMGMTSGHGTASSMSDAVSSTDSVNSDIDTNLTNADSETAEWSIQTTTEYGFAAPLLDRNGRATPFFRSTHSADARSFVSGVRMDVTDNIGVTAESNRHIPADDDPYSEHAVGLEARWEF